MGPGWRYPQLIEGNAGQVQYARDPVYAADMYDPATDTFTSMSPATNKRLYHSGAVLLSTGHVIAVGSEMEYLTINTATMTTTG
jgi:hypothetical protein